MKNFRVAFFDIDGTLVDNQLPHTLPFGERIPSSAKLALRKLKENQIEPVIASGRNHQTLAALAEELGVDSIISSNGNCVHYQGKIIHRNSIPNDLLEKLIAHLEQEEIAYLIETADLIYSYEGELQNENHPSKKALLRQSDPLPENVLQLIVGWNERTDFKLGIDSPLIAEKVAPVAANIHLKTGTKAEGIHKICAEMAITADQALAFGDEENDFTMFDAVGFPVAMGNAAPTLKEKAAHVTAPVSDDGIWKACVELGLIAE